MLCKRCGTEVSDDGNFCQKCGQAVASPWEDQKEEPRTQLAPSGIVALVVRSGILGVISSPVYLPQAEYPVAAATWATVAAVIGLILYGIEKVVLLVLRYKSAISPLVSVFYRSALLAFIVSFLKFSDLGRALGNMITGGILLGLFLYAMEQAIKKTIYKVRSTRR